MYTLHIHVCKISFKSKMFDQVQTQESGRHRRGSRRFPIWLPRGYLEGRHRPRGRIAGRSQSLRQVPVREDWLLLRGSWHHCRACKWYFVWRPRGGAAGDAGGCGYDSQETDIFIIFILIYDDDISKISKRGRNMRYFVKRTGIGFRVHSETEQSFLERRKLKNQGFA